MVKIKSEICDILGIEYPIFQGAMAWIAMGEFAAAVSNAGGLGIIASSQAPCEIVHEQVKICKKLTDKPFCLNLMLQSPYIDEVVDMLIAEEVKIVTTGAGSPARFMDKLNAAGVKVIPVIPNVKSAKKVAELGATAVVAEGTESGGHVGEMTTLALLPQVLNAVDIPVLAAGGIADGRTMAGMMLMGAAGVQMGTAFLATKECPISPEYRQAVLGAIDTDTVVTGRGTSHAVRSIKNQMTDDYLAFEKVHDHESMDKLGAGALKRAVDGDVVTGTIMAGQISGMVNEETTCKELIEKMMNEAVETLNKASDLYTFVK